MTAAVDEQHSLLIVKNLFRISIASIAYLRDLFAEENFHTASYAELRVKRFKPQDDEAATLHRWLETDVFDALAKGCLRQLSFDICRDPSGLDLIERYEFVITTIDPDHTKLAEKSVDTIREETVKVIGGLLRFVENIDSLPVERHVVTRFACTTDPPETPQYGCGCVEAGSVATPYHKFSVRVAGDVNPIVDGAAPTGPYRNGVKPSLRIPVTNLCLNASLPVKQEPTPMGDKYKHAKYKHETMQPASVEAEDEVVVMSSPEKTNQLTAIALLRILKTDTAKFGETRLGSLVKRSPMDKLMKRMMQGTKESSCAVFAYSAMEKLVALGYVELHSRDNGKGTDMEARPHLYDSKGNLKSDTIIVITSQGHNYLESGERPPIKRGRGRPKGSFKNKAKRLQQANEDSETKRKRESVDVMVPGDFAFTATENVRGDMKRLKNS